MRTTKKTTAPRARSRLSAAIHETAAGLRRSGLMDKATLREFDASCLTVVAPLSAREIVAIRRRAGVSQGVFAHYLNVKPKLVSEWERGEKRPSGPSLKLLSLVKAKGLDAIM
ncbi:DNA-binding transcriptional regulator [Xanthobacteraceae bacterium Astr-EGSB]|uniref:helix-turn-helix domain-containing protein n=1 Tax=Astrobacterium formosum TaxID=3069710 RepID=UPI0027B71C0B|nr:DNA-binding transcriptional regulator [Xanthobacteraceae bacterium Astr-EGSB]